MTDLRNIAIIAHVDHGKTTLVDEMLKQSGAVSAHKALQERAMDSNDLERERGITILAKCTTVIRDSAQINIVDTPGHADFGGEVERILSMVDGAILLVDAAEGPMPQTKFVLSKALARGLAPIVVINKCDRHDARAEEVLDEIFDLFVALDAQEHQLDFPVLYAVGRDGWAHEDSASVADILSGAVKGSLDPLFARILQHVPAPDVQPQAPFACLVSLIESDPYLGRLLTGRISAGKVQRNMTIKALAPDGTILETARISKILAFRGLERVALEEAVAGDIVSLAGFAEAGVADTLCDPEVMAALPALPVDPPTLTMRFQVNDGPLSGRDGDKVTSREILARLEREAEGNVAIHVEILPERDAFAVSGRGELQLAVLIETMRREGFELCVGRPRVLFREDGGQKLEPIEEVVVDVDEAYAGTVVEKISQRKGELVEMRPSGGGKQRLVFHAPTRGLIGYHSEFLTDTRGTGIMNRLFHDWQPHRGTIAGRHMGALIADRAGTSVSYALVGLEPRGALFIGAGEDVYPGMIVGLHSKGPDLEVNLLKSKQLTNFRAAGKDDMIRLTPPMRMGLEAALSWIGDDELVEVTPRHIRLRKTILDPHERKRQTRKLVSV